MPATETPARRPDRNVLPAQTVFPDGGRGGPEHASERLLTWGALLLIAVGVAMRIWSLGARPYGLCPDEAFNGLDAVSVLQGVHPLYFPANNGREPLFIYLMAATIQIFGRNPLGLRAAAALCGLLTLLAAYVLGSAWGNRRVGLLSAALLSGTLWHLHLSRVGFRVVMLPLFLILALGLGALALRSRSRNLLIGAGVVYGLSFYTYLAARFTPLALLVMAAYGLVWHREILRNRWRDGVWILAAALVTAMPLAIYAVLHPDIAFQRSSDVAIWHASGPGGQPQPGLGENIVRVLGMFTWQGDVNWRHNVPHRPVFDPLLSLVFLASVGMAVQGWRRRPAWALCLIWLAVMTLPTVLSGEAPHFLRAVGVLPALVLLPALTLDAGLRWATRGTVRSDRDAGSASGPGRWARSLRTFTPVAVLLLLSGGTALSARDYFGQRSAPAIPLSGFDYAGAYLSDPICGYAFFAPITDLAREINTAAGPVFVDRLYWDTLSPLRFLVPESDRIRRYDAQSTLSAGPLPLTLIGWPRPAMAPILNVLPTSAQIDVAQGPKMRDESGKYFDAYVRWSAEALPHDLPVKLSHPLARFASGLDLVALQTVMAPGHLSVRLSWSKETPEVASAAVVVEGMDANGRPAGRAEEAVGTVYYPPQSWRSDNLAVQHVSLPLPAGGPVPRHLRLVLADLATGKEIAVSASEHSRQGNVLVVPLGRRGKETTP
jgi:4-amino-4-deoxy-L-arabinose transferase-like glycosyltransferase